MEVTPAKWQTAEADQRLSSKMTYREFRKKLVPHMSYICFYPDASDVFDIGLKGGISYFLLLKQQNTKSVVKNIMTSQKYFNGIVERDIRNGAIPLFGSGETNLQVSGVRDQI